MWVLKIILDVEFNLPPLSCSVHLSILEMNKFSPRTHTEVSAALYMFDLLKFCNCENIQV